MKQADLFIYSGLLIFLFGMGDDAGKVFSNDIKLIVGIACITYGVLLYFLSNKKVEKFTFSFPQKLSELPTKVYLIIGVLTLRIDRFLPFISDNLIFAVIQLVIGGAICIYGLNRFLLEKRMKRESGSIEK